MKWETSKDMWAEKEIKSRTSEGPAFLSSAVRSLFREDRRNGTKPLPSPCTRNWTSFVRHRSKALDVPYCRCWPFHALVCRGLDQSFGSVCLLYQGPTKLGILCVLIQGCYHRGSLYCFLSTCSLPLSVLNVLTT